MASTLMIGTSGWSYPSGRGTWNGVFYPKRGKARSAHFDELAYYAEHFRSVEVNSTFYGQPRPDVTRGWAERTPPGFEFSVKLYQKFTHPEMYREAAGKRLPGDAGPVPDALIHPTGSDIDEFRRGLDPLAAADKLGALLAQFPPSFKRTPATEDYLAALLSVFGDYGVAVELRHRSWSDALGDTLRLLEPQQAAWVQIDEPKFQFSIRQNYLPNTNGIYYMRLHGRNAARWWQHDKGEDRYDYLYSPDELRPFADAVGASRALVKKVYLYLNNHFAAKAVANAVALKHELGDPIEGTYPAEMIATYPFLQDLVRVDPAPSTLPEGPHRIGSGGRA